MEKKVKLVFVCLGILIVIVFCTVPFIYMIIISLKRIPDMSFIQQGLSWTLQNYNAILHSPTLHFWDYLRNSLVISLISSFFSVGIAALAAYAITRLNMPGKMAVLLSVLCVAMFPQISLIGYLFKFLSRLGWINTYQGLIFPYVAWSLPLSIWILVSYFSQIPKDMDMAAIMDGCSHGQILWHILLPVTFPGLFSCGLLAFIFSFNEFLFALMLTTDHHVRTIPVGITLFQGLHGQVPWGHIMAASTVSVLPVILLLLIFHKNIVEDLTRGAVNG